MTRLSVFLESPAGAATAWIVGCFPRFPVARAAIGSAFLCRGIARAGSRRRAFSGLGPLMGVHRGKINRIGDGVLAFDTGVLYSIRHEREMTTMRATDEQKNVASAFVAVRVAETQLTGYHGAMPRQMADAYA